MKSIHNYLTVEDFNLLQANAEQLQFAPGEIILAQNSQNNALFFINQGFIEIRQDGLTVARLGPHEMFGEMSLLEKTHTSAAVITATASQVARISDATIEDLFSQYPTMASRFYKTLAARLSARLRSTSQLFITSHKQNFPTSKLLRTNLLTKTQIPRELLVSLTAIKASLAETEKFLQQENINSGDAYQKVETTLNDALELLANYTSKSHIFEISYADLMSFRNDDVLRSGVGAIIFRELFPVLMLSHTIAHLYAKPRGILEDFESILLMRRNKPMGDGVLGPLVDQWFLNRFICQGRRAEIPFAMEYLKQAKAHFGEIFCCDLGAGASAIIPFFDENSTSRLTCIDSDAMALQNIQEEVKNGAQTIFVETILTDIRKLWSQSSQIEMDPQQVFLALGLFEYMEEKDIMHLYHWIMHYLIDGGLFLFTTINPTHPDLDLMSHLLEWNVKPRTEEKLHYLFNHSRLSSRAKLTIYKTENHMLHGIIEANP